MPVVEPRSDHVNDHGRINHLGARGPRPLRDEQGFAMIIAIGVLFVTALLITATFVALDGELISPSTTCRASRLIMPPGPVGSVHLPDEP